MKQGLFAELKRRHVYRVAVAYAVVGWLVIQAAATVSPYLHLPDTLTTMVIVVVALGFPVAIILAWAFEVTPGGVRRTEPADSPEARQADQQRKVGRKLDFVIIAVLALALSLAVWRPWAHRKHPVIVNVPSSGHAVASTSASAAGTAAAQSTGEAPKAIPAKSIAVLPFENLSSDKANGYFSDGIQDLILTKLADIGDLAVISRTSTMKYGSHPENLQEIGRQLGVATILEGSVQKVGDQVLVNVQLIDTRNDHHIWANSYRRTLKDVFSVEGEVASKIAATLNAKLSPEEAQRLATTLSGNAAANDLYLRAEYFTNRGITNYDTAALKQAITFYRQAIAKAPDFAQAHARLSTVESELAWFGGGGIDTATLYSDALAQAQQALKLAPDLADAHLAMGFYDYWGKGDYAAALKAFGEALTLRPNDDHALAAQAFVLRRQGKLDEAIESLRKALALDPRNTPLTNETGETYMMAGRYAEAEQTFQRALALDPTNLNARSYYGISILFDTGDLSRALQKLQGDDPALKLPRVFILEFSRRYAEALALLQSIPDTPDTFGSNLFGPKSLLLANLHHFSGDAARARALYAKALPEARAQYVALKGSPDIIQGSGLFYMAMAELGLGQTSQGLADVARMRAIAEHSADNMYAPGLLVNCAQAYAFAGKPDQAVRMLSQALASPGLGFSYSPVMLWLDPNWDPIRKTSAFRALENKYVRYRPAHIPGAQR